MKKNIFILIAYISTTVVSIAQAGSLDLSFDADGKVTTSIGVTIDYGRAMQIQSDGKIVVAGASSLSDYDFAVLRYNTDGTLDNSFDGDGKVIVNFGSFYTDIATSMALQSDGKIVIAGYSNNGSTDDFAIARLNTDGSLDSTFNSDGMVTTAIGSGSDQANAITIQTDGKIVLAGTSYNGADNDFALARYNTNGSMDNTFDADGKLTTAVGPSIDNLNAVTIQPDGKIMAGGAVYNGSSNTYALVRYNINGALDIGFDSDGIVTTDITPQGDYIYALVIQPDGKILAGGGGYNGNQFTLARYNTDGSLDTNFDTDGLVSTDICPDVELAQSMILQPDGKIIMAGYVRIGSDFYFALACYHSDGSLDNSFDMDGMLTTAFGNADDKAYAICQQTDGKIIVAGQALMTDDDFALARYHTCSILPSVTAHATVLNATVCEGESMALYGSGAFSYLWSGGAVNGNYFIPDTTQTYFVTGTDMNGCTNTDTILVTVNPLPNTSITASDTINGVMLAANTSGAYYMWIDCNNGNAPLPGILTQSYLATTNGSYAVIIFQNGCVDTSSCQSVIITFGIETGNIQNTAEIYPNPNNGIFTLSLNKQIKEGTLKILNLNGQVVEQKNNLNGNIFIFDMMEYPDGIYLLELIEHEDISRIKFIIN